MSSGWPLRASRQASPPSSGCRPRLTGPGRSVRRARHTVRGWPRLVLRPSVDETSRRLTVPACRRTIRCSSQRLLEMHPSEPSVTLPACMLPSTWLVPYIGRPTLHPRVTGRWSMTGPGVFVPPFHFPRHPLASRMANRFPRPPDASTSVQSSSFRRCIGLFKMRPHEIPLGFVTGLVGWLVRRTTTNNWIYTMTP